jgi:hypothetical protein
MCGNLSLLAPYFLLCQWRVSALQTLVPWAAAKLARPLSWPTWWFLPVAPPESTSPLTWRSHLFMNACKHSFKSCLTYCSEMRLSLAGMELLTQGLRLWGRDNPRELASTVSVSASTLVSHWWAVCWLRITGSLWKINYHGIQRSCPWQHEDGIWLRNLGLHISTEKWLIFDWILWRLIDSTRWACGLARCITWRELIIFSAVGLCLIVGIPNMCYSNLQTEVL